MTHDRRYPHMYPVEQTLPGHANVYQNRIRRFAREVCGRTGTKAFYNARNGKVLFSYTDCSGGPVAVPAVGPGGEWYSPNADDATLYINMGRNMHRDEKDKIAAMNEKTEKYEKDEDQRKFLESRRPSAKDHLEFLDQKRRGVRKIISV